MSLYKSRKRNLEEAVQETLETYAGTAIDGVQILLGRDITVQEPTHIRIHAGSQEPMTGEEDLLLNFRVTCTITVQQSMDRTRDQVDTLDGIVEGYVEQDSDTIVSALNTCSVPNFGVWEFQPESCEDDIDEENRRYLSAYTFSAIVGHATY